MSRINAKQWKILVFILDFRRTYGYSPSIREITRGCSLKSSSLTLYHIDDLCISGYIDRKPGISRSLTLTAKGLSVVPLDLEFTALH
jgi:repressor LexA